MASIDKQVRLFRCGIRKPVYCRPACARDFNADIVSDSKKRRNNLRLHVHSGAWNRDRKAAPHRQLDEPRHCHIWRRRLIH